MALVKNIDEVIAQLEAIMDECARDKNRAGYFAALYHRVTCRVRDGIRNNEFEDGQRLERLDVLFANKYLEAWEQWKTGKQPVASWHIAFQTTKRSSAIVLQHLLLGINAHINLDLGIAAVETSKEAGQTLDFIEKDFVSINTILAALTYEVINDINRVSPLLSFMGFHATNQNSILIQFTISNARDGAWRFAKELYNKAEADYANYITKRDKTIRQLAEGLTYPTGLLRFTLWLIHAFEWHNPARIIKELREYRKKYFTISG